LKKQTGSLLSKGQDMTITTWRLQLIVLITSLLFSFAGMACTTDAWIGGVTGAPLADSPPTVSRVSGLCGMELSAAGSVKDTNFAGEATAYIRFYVKAELNGGTPIIFEAFSDDSATASLFTVTFDGSNFVFDANDSGSGDVVGKSGWNLVEMAWVGGAGMDYWVNTDSSNPPTGTVSASAGSMESVVLGPAAGLDGVVTFDDYESHWITPIGELLAGDGNQDGNINSGDINVIVNEFLFGTLGEGVVDCNLDGNINSGDINCVVAIFLGL
jgi:hypothetical protein